MMSRDEKLLKNPIFVNLTVLESRSQVFFNRNTEAFMKAAHTCEKNYFVYQFLFDLIKTHIKIAASV
jgi:hypothetical protein